MMTRNIIATLFLILLTLTGCVTTSPRTMSVAEGPKDYVMGIGDRLNITVYGHEDLSGEFVIEQNGMISFPLIQNVPASGYTAKELAATITERLTPAYLVDARVSVDVATFRSVYILGEVGKPGQYEYVPNMTLLQAVAIAGGYTYRAKENEADVTRHVTGALTTFTVNEKTMLKPGDTVVIGRRWF